MFMSIYFRKMIKTESTVIKSRFHPTIYSHYILGITQSLAFIVIPCIDMRLSPLVPRSFKIMDNGGPVQYSH